MAVLDAAGIPKRRRPRWEDDPDRFWFEISELVAGGKVPAGRAGLMAAVVQESPAGLFEWAPRRWAMSSPASLLWATRQVVDFHGREEELTDLRRWCEGGGSRTRLIVGPAGQGKTRLVMRLCAVMRSVGWDAGLLSPEADEQVFDAAANSDRPLLLVIDRVEARPARCETVLTRLVDPRLAAGAVVRVLLLTRSLSAGSLWWDLTGARSSEVGRHALVPEPLGALAPNGEPLGVYLTALGAFAEAWSDVEPDTDWGALAARLILPGDLVAPAAGLTFTLHLRALTDLLQAGPHRVMSGEQGARPEDVLLAHEARYWRQAATRRRLRQPDSVTRAAVAAAALCGAQDADEATAVLGGLPEFAGADVSARLAVAEWLRDLYPAQAGEYWGTLVPDLIAEHHLGRVLRERPGMAAALLTAASDRQLANGLIALARAGDHQPHLPAILAALLTEHPTISLRTGQLAPDALVDLVGALPHESVATTEAAATVVAQATRDAKPDTLPDLPLIFPELLTTLADRLIVLGRPEAALTAVREATRLYRLLDAAPAGSAPGAITNALADAVNTTSALLARLGRPVEALAAAEESVAAYRRSAAAQPGTARAELGLASALHSLSERVADFGRLEEAVAADEEAVAILQRHDEARPGLFSASLADALISLSLHLADLERHADATAPAMAALAINRRLVEQYPAIRAPAFAVSLSLAAVRQAEAGDRHRAIPLAREAVTAFHELYRIHPAKFADRLTSALAFLGQLLLGTGQTEATLRALIPALELAAGARIKEMVPVIIALLREERGHDRPAFDAAWTTIADAPVPDGL